MKTILIITANDAKDRLPLLARECNTIQQSLNEVKQKNYDVVSLSEATTAEIINALNVPKRTVEILHYAGHADSQSLRLNDVDANARAFADKLGATHCLKLVFINGCASRGQVLAFHEVGIPFVIATSRSVADTKAAWLAIQFYNYLCKGKSVRKAFEQVKLDADFGQHHIPFGQKRGIGQINDLDTPDLLWDLYGRDGEKTDDYSLPLGSGAIPHALTKPPFLSEIFLGREDDLKVIRQKLFESDNMLLLVNGQGGVGKTSIAAKYYDMHQNDYAHTAWVLSERSIANALLSNLAHPLGLVFEQNETEAERLDKLLRGMANLDKPCLLVIDNANEIADLERNYLLLRRCSNFHLLLTSRITHFEQAATHAIQGLPEAEALQLFKRYYPKLKAAEEPIFAQIHKAVGGNTLVVEVLAKNLALFHGIRQQYSLHTMLTDLQTRGLLALTKSASVKTGYQAKDVLRSETPEAIIAAMYDLSDLTREQTALLSVFAVLPAESIEFEWLEMLLLSTTPPLGEGEALEQNALALAQRGWIEYDDTITAFKCNPVIQEITRKKNPILRGDCETLIRSLIKKLDRDTIHLDNYEQAAMAARYGESVINALTTPDWNINVLCDGMGYYYQQVGNLSKALFIYEIQRKLVEKLITLELENADLKNSLGTTLSWLGSIHAALGNLDKALQFYEDDAELTKQLYESYPNNVEFKNGLAISYSKLGETHSALGNLDKALHFYEDETQLFEQLYESYPNNVEFKNGLAISYSKLGETHAALGNLDKALQFYEERSVLGKQLYDSYPNNVSFKNGLAISYEKLGETHTALGNLDKALQFYEERSALGKQLYESYPNNVSFKNGLAISYSKLGSFYHYKKPDLTKARYYYEACKKLWSELATTFPTYVEFKNNLAWVEGRLKDL